MKEGGGGIEEGSTLLEKRYCIGGQVLQTILTYFKKLPFVRQFKKKKSVIWIFITWDKYILPTSPVTTKTRSNQDNQLSLLSVQFCTYHPNRITKGAATRCVEC